MRIPNHLGRSVVIVLALVSAGFFGAYLRFLPYLEREATYTDGRRSIELNEVDRLRFAVWDDAVPLSPVVNTRADEGRAVISPDGRLLVFTVGEAGLNADLWVAELVDGEPVDPRPLGRMNSPGDDLAPAFTREALYFASSRPGGRGGLDLYRADYRDGVFAPPEALPPGLNTGADETDPAPLAGGSLAFASNRSRGRRTDFDLYLARPRAEGEAPQQDDGGADTDPAELAAGEWIVHAFEVVNTPFDEREPAFAGDGLLLVFASDRVEGAGGFDLWRSVQSVGHWQPPEVLPGLNTAASERAPWPSPDGFTLLFSAENEAGDLDLHRAQSRELFRLPGKPVGWFDLTLLALLLLIALLAWLGRRWEALDILYKCLLISLLVHLGLMFWFREVPVEPEDVSLPQGTPSFKVRLAPTRAALARNTERAGQLEVARAELSGPSAPERTETEATEPGGRAEAARGGLPSPTTAQAEAPGRGEAEAERMRSAAASSVATELSDAPTEGPRITGGAPAVTVVAAATGAAPVERSGSERPRVTRQAGRNAAAPDGSVDGPSQSSLLAMPSTVARSEPSRPARAVGPPERRGGAFSAPSVAVEGPASESPPVAAGRTEQAPEVDVSSLAAATSGGRASRGASRPERRLTGTGELLAEADPGGAVAPAMRRLTPNAGASGVGPALPGRSTDTPSAPRASGGAAIALDDAVAEEPGAADRHRPGAGPVADGREGIEDGRIGALSLVALTATASSSRRSETGGAARPGRWSNAIEPEHTDAPVAPAFTPLAAIEVAVAELPELSDTPGEAFDHTPYRTRFGEAKVRALEEYGGTVETERAVAAGLRYLASVQDDSGYWGSTRDYDDKYGHVTVGKTGLALLAFLGAGHTPDSGTEYSDVTRRAVNLLLEVQDPDSGHFGYTTAYSHGVATYALAECFALTRDERLRAPLEAAVACIVGHQSRSRDRRNAGGWGYYYPDDRTYDPWSRVSVTTWQVMALESARLGGLEVDDEVFADARGFLRRMHDPDRGVILYNQDPVRLADSRAWTLPGSTPAGLFALSLLGEDLTGSRYRSTIEYVSARAPDRYGPASDADFINRARANLYFWYYGSLALFRHGGEEWDDWNRQLQGTLLPNQQSDGSWRQISVYAEYAGDDARDRSYTTAMCVLTLEVYYRYFTPLLEVR